MIPFLVLSLIAYILVQVFSKSKTPDRVMPSGNLIIFDTETNGFPLDWDGLQNDTNNWPRIVSIGWYKIAPNGKILHENFFMIKPMDG